MAFLNADGLFHGDRLRACSNGAQLHFPRLFLISNGFGRFEVSYLRIIGAAYGSFNPPPTEKELEGVILEFAKNHLLFLYDSAGFLWGLWDTKAEWLPRYRTAQDRRSPEPPQSAFALWKAEYRGGTKGVPKFCENYGKIPLVVVDVVVEKQICASADADPRFSVDDAPFDPVGTSSGNTWNDPPRQPKRNTARKPAQADEWFSEFWEVYRFIKPQAKAKAKEVFHREIKSREELDRVLTALAKQKPELLEREPRFRPQASTWLSGERWEDDETDEAPKGNASSGPDYYKPFSPEYL